jgi:mRNA interferase RelE/StbE
MVSYSLEIVRSAQKDIKKLPAEFRPRVIKDINRLAHNPRPIGCEKLKGSKSSYRIRLGDYRVIYKITDTRLIISVVRVAHRREAYKNL